MGVISGGTERPSHRSNSIELNTLCRLFRETRLVQLDDEFCWEESRCELALERAVGLGVPCSWFRHHLTSPSRNVKGIVNTKKREVHDNIRDYVT